MTPVRGARTRTGKGRKRIIESVVKHTGGCHCGRVRFAVTALNTKPLDGANWEAYAAELEPLSQDDQA